MPIRLLRSADYSRQAWKNGGGTTEEIFREDLPNGDVAFRLSIAAVERDGPFSTFPGIDRTIMLLAGHGMILDHKGVGSHRLDRLFAPHAFSGDVETDCRLIDGPCRDLNLMVRRSIASGSVSVMDMSAGSMVSGLPKDVRLLHILSGVIAVNEFAARAGDTLALEEGAAPSIRTSEPVRLALIHVRWKGKP